MAYIMSFELKDVNNHEDMDRQARPISQRYPSLYFIGSSVFSHVYLHGFKSLPVRAPENRMPGYWYGGKFYKFSMKQINRCANSGLNES